jgi:hypothetical protein
MSEHEDFHYAHELQMEENKTNTIKRKNNKSNQTLDAFLNKKPKNE